MQIEINAEDNASDDISQVQGSLSNMRKAAAAAGAAMAAIGVGGLAKATQAAANFEEAMVEVEKVTSEATAEELNKSIREMAETIPMSQEALAGLAADAARFGVRGPENIEKFTETAAKMAQATELNASEAGESLARLAELTNTPISEMENLGATINTLSNNFGTSSQEIVDSMLRASGAMSQMGMNQRQIAGISAAMNEVSESSQRAGTRLRRLTQEMMNPKKVGKFANALGMTEQEFIKMRKNNPQKLIMRMAKAMKDGGKQADALRSSLSTTSRQALSGLAQNLDGARNAMDQANTSFQKGDSLQKEFNKSTDTFNAQMTLLQNKLRNVAITIGQQLLPVILKVMNEAILPAVNAFAKFNKKTNGVAGAVTLLTMVVGGLATALAAVAPVITGTVLPALDTVVTVLTGPVGLAILAIIAAVGALWYAWDNNLGNIQGAVKGFVKTIKQSFKNVKNNTKGLGKAIKTVKSLINGALKVIKKTIAFVFENYTIPLLKKLEKLWKLHFEAIAQETVKTLNHVLGIVQKVLGHVQEFWKRHGDEIMAIVKMVFSFIQTYIVTVLDGILTAIRVVLALIRGDWKKALDLIWGFVQRTFGRIVDFISGPFLKGLGAALDLVFGLIADIFKGIYDFLIGGSIVPETFNAIIKFIKKDFFEGLKKVLTSVFDFYVSIWTKIFDVTKKVFSKLTEFVKKGLKAYFKLWKTIFTKAWDFFKSIFTKVFKFYVSIWTELFNFASEGLQKLWKAYKKVWLGIFKFIKNTMKKIFDKITGAITNVASWIGSDGLSALGGAFGNAFSKAFNTVKGWMRDIKRHVEDIFNGIVNFIGGDAARNISREVGRIVDSVIRSADEMVRDVGRRVDDLGRDMKRRMERAGRAVERTVRDVAREVGSTARDMGRELVDEVRDAIRDLTRAFNRAVPNYLRVPRVRVGGGRINIPDPFIGGHVNVPHGPDISFGERIHTPDINIPSASIGGQFLDLPQLAQGGIVDQATLAMIGEGSQAEAVVPLDKLSSMMETSFRAGATGAGGKQSVEVSLRVEGDDELTRLIRENAEVVVEGDNERKKDRLRRF